MSKQADRVLREMLENREQVPWETAVREVRQRCGVKTNTAETYIRRSDESESEKDADGNRYVVPKGGSATRSGDDKTIVEKPPGEPTGRTYGNVEILEDIRHPEVPAWAENGYIKRRMSDNPDSALYRKTDVEVVSAGISDKDFSTLLIGPHAAGKDFLILHIAANAHVPTIRLVAKDDPDFVDLLFGGYTPSESGGLERGKGLLQIAIENGYWFILDEFNSLSGKLQTTLHKLLEDSNQSHLVIPETNEVIEPHEQFRFIGTMNPNEMGYGSREEVDQATGSRFFPMRIPPLGEDGERQAVAKKTHWDSDSPTLRNLIGNDGVISGLRQLHEMGKLTMRISTRDVIQIGRLAKQLNDPKAATESVLLGRVDGSNQETVQSKINDTRW